MHKGVIVQWFVGRRDFLERHQEGAGVSTKWVWLRRPIQIPGSAGIPFKVVFGVLVIAKDPLKRVRAVLRLVAHLAVRGRVALVDWFLHRSDIGVHSAARRWASATGASPTPLLRSCARG